MKPFEFGQVRLEELYGALPMRSSEIFFCGGYVCSGDDLTGTCMYCVGFQITKTVNRGHPYCTSTPFGYL